MIFIAFLIGVIVIGAWAGDKGDYRRMIHGTDSYGNLCGVDNDKAITSDNSGLNLAGYK
jgi:hypothetical protein